MTYTSSGFHNSFCLLLSSVLVSLTLATPTNADPLMDQAKSDYSRYCRICHGADAGGAGPLAKDLTTKPTNLTLISKRNNGIFPMIDIMDKIDARGGIAAHGSGEMPIWGDAFRDEDLVRALGRITGLALYLHSLQEK